MLRHLLTAALLLVALRATAHAHRGVHEQIGQLSRELRAAPRSLALLLRRARLYRQHGEHGHALADLRRALRVAPRDPAIHHERAELELAQRRPRAALVTLRTLESLPGGLGWHGWLLRARALSRLALHPRALAAYDRAIAQGARTPDVYLERGLLAERLARPALAARGYRAGLAALDGAVVLRLALIRVEVAQGHHAAARAQIDLVLARLPVKAPWLLRRAAIYAHEGRRVDAERDRRAALAEARELFASRPSRQNRALVARARRALATERTR